MGATLLRWSGYGRILSAVFVRFSSNPGLRVFWSLRAVTEQHGEAPMAAIQWVT
jgi:hypothetical protein